MCVRWVAGCNKDAAWEAGREAGAITPAEMPPPTADVDVTQRGEPQCWLCVGLICIKISRGGVGCGGTCCCRRCDGRWSQCLRALAHAYAKWAPDARGCGIAHLSRRPQRVGMLHARGDRGQWCFLGSGWGPVDVCNDYIRRYVLRTSARACMLRLRLSLNGELHSTPCEHRSLAITHLRPSLD